jgi:hypothetical protein
MKGLALSEWSARVVVTYVSRYVRIGSCFRSPPPDQLYKLIRRTPSSSTPKMPFHTLGAYFGTAPRGPSFINALAGNLGRGRRSCWRCIRAWQGAHLPRALAKWTGCSSRRIRYWYSAFRWSLCVYVCPRASHLTSDPHMPFAHKDNLDDGDHTSHLHCHRP